MEFDILGLGGSVPPPRSAAPIARQSTNPTNQQSVSHSINQSNQNSSVQSSIKQTIQHVPSPESEEDEAEYERELRLKRSGMRRHKRRIDDDHAFEQSNSSPINAAVERTRAEERDEFDDDDDDATNQSINWSRLSLGDDDDDQSSQPMINRSAWIEEQMQLREDEFTTDKTVRLFLGSWNVNAKKPSPSESISPWLLPPDELEDDVEDVTEETVLQSINQSTPCDIYVIGFQEIVDLNAASLISDHTASVPWDAAILATLNKSGKTFQQISTVHLVGLSMSVFVRERYVKAISDVRIGTVGTGIMGVGGNKGAVIIRFELFKSSFCFVNSHLAAHQKKVSARNRDYANILKRALLLPAPGQIRKRKLYTDTTNKLKLQPWREEADIDEEESDDEADDEGEGMAVTNAGETSQAVSALSQSLQNSAIKDANVSNQPKREVISVGGREVNLGGMKKFMAAGLSSFKKGVATTIQTINQQVESYSGPTEAELREGYRLYESDHIFWIGDLNYRLNVSSMKEVHDLIDVQRWRKLLTSDQLLIEKKRGHAFEGFAEGRIRFPPTYKYKTGTHLYDKDPKKARYPAYCDRIQWCSNDEEAINQLYYRRAGILKISDHKPVMSAFECPVKKDVVAKKDALRDHLEELSERASDCVPKCAVSAQFIDWSEVRFEVPIIKTFKLKNIGQSVIQFKCSTSQNNQMKQPTNQPINQLVPWYTIDPLEGVIHPERVVTITISCYVDRYCAYLLNTDELLINQAVTVRFTPRHAAQLPVRGRYLKSVLGSDLSWLLSLPAPIRGPAANDGRSAAPRTGVPFEIVRLVDHIVQCGGLQAKGNYYPPAILPPEDSSRGYAQFNATPQIRYICEQLDTGRPFDQVATANQPAIKLPTHFFVQALLYVFHSMHKPLFFKRARPHNAPSTNSPTSHAAKHTLTGWTHEAINDLPIEHYRTLKYVIGYFKQVLKTNSSSGFGAEELATCVAGSIMHRIPDEAYSDKVTFTPMQIMQHFLTESQWNR